MLEISYTPLLVLDFGLDIVNSIRRLDLEGDSLAREAAQEKTMRQITDPQSSDNHGFSTYVFTKICIVTDAPVYPTKSTVESLTKASAGLMRRERRSFADDRQFMKSGK